MAKESGVDNRQKWIEVGYDLFGEIGAEALNVEKLSTLVGLNRSSFYHYFKDLERFEEALFEHHKIKYQLIGDIIKDYDRLDQLFSDEVFVHKNALAFQRQLLINQSNSRYQNCSIEVRKYTEEKTFELWKSEDKQSGSEEEQWAMFRAMRDFYFVHHGQSVGEEDPKETVILLNKFLNRDV